MTLNSALKSSECELFTTCHSKGLHPTFGDDSWEGGWEINIFGDDCWGEIDIFLVLISHHSGDKFGGGESTFLVMIVGWKSMFLVLIFGWGNPRFWGGSSPKSWGGREGPYCDRLAVQRRVNHQKRTFFRWYETSWNNSSRSRNFWDLEIVNFSITKFTFRKQINENEPEHLEMNVNWGSNRSNLKALFTVCSQGS